MEKVKAACLALKLDGLVLLGGCRTATGRYVGVVCGCVGWGCGWMGVWAGVRIDVGVESIATTHNADGCTPMTSLSPALSPHPPQKTPPYKPRKTRRRLPHRVPPGPGRRDRRLRGALRDRQHPLEPVRGGHRRLPLRLPGRLINQPTLGLVSSVFMSSRVCPC